MEENCRRNKNSTRICLCDKKLENSKARFLERKITDTKSGEGGRGDGDDEESRDLWLQAKALIA